MGRGSHSLKVESDSPDCSEDQDALSITQRHGEAVQDRTYGVCYNFYILPIRRLKMGIINSLNTHITQPRKFARYYRLRKTFCVFCHKLAWCSMRRPQKKYPKHVPMLLCDECREKVITC